MNQRTALSPSARGGNPGSRDDQRDPQSSFIEGELAALAVQRRPARSAEGSIFAEEYDGGSVHFGGWQTSNQPPDLGVHGLDDGSRDYWAGVVGKLVAVQRLDALSVRELPGTEGGVNPFWSPDGRWVGFFKRRTVLKVPLDGGDPITITTMDLECAPPACGGSWTGDGHVLVSSGAAAVLRAPEGGGSAEVLIDFEPGEHFHEATWLPGGAVVVVVDPDEASGHVDLWDGRRIHWHNGQTGGYASYCAIDKQRGVGVVALTNANKGPDAIGRSILRELAEPAP